jgi:hypothetical protein
MTTLRLAPTMNKYRLDTVGVVPAATNPPPMPAAAPASAPKK